MYLLDEYKLGEVAPPAWPLRRVEDFTSHNSEENLNSEAASSSNTNPLLPLLQVIGFHPGLVDPRAIGPVLLCPVRPRPQPPSGLQNHVSGSYPTFHRTCYMFNNILAINSFMKLIYKCPEKRARYYII